MFRRDTRTRVPHGQAYRLRVGLEGDRWSGSLFVRNVWDERAVTFRSNRWAVPRLSIIQPRTYGLQFRYEF